MDADREWCSEVRADGTYSRSAQARGKPALATSEVCHNRGALPSGGTARGGELVHRRVVLLATVFAARLAAAVGCACLMPGLHELRGVDSFIYSRLTGDAALFAIIGTKVYTRPAPQGTTVPYVIATFLSSPDRTALGPGIRIMTRPLYLVRCVTTDPNTLVANQIADRIDAALMGADGSVAAEGIFIGKVQREEPVRYEETTPDSAIIFQHTGGRYRFFVESLGG